MKAPTRIINVSIGILLLLIATESFAQSFSRKQAYDEIISKNIIDTLKSEVYISKRIIPKDTILKLWYKEIIVVPINSYIVFIDDDPLAGWSHPCRYVFFDPYSGDYSVINHRFPTSASLKDLYIKINSINKSIFINQINPQWPDNKGCSNKESENNYAVIISGGHNLAWNWSRYWSSCSEIYKMLVSYYDYCPQQINVIMADGTNPNPDRTWPDGTTDSSPLDLNGDGTDDIQYAATKDNITTVFNELKSILTPEDNLFIYVTDHGHNPDLTNKNVYMSLWGEVEFWDYEFAQLVNEIDAGTMQIVFTQCYSGGFIDNLQMGTHGRTITTSCDYNQPAHGDISFNNGIGINNYTWAFISASIGSWLGYNNPPIDISSEVDVNFDGEYCITEITDWAKNWTLNHPGNFEDLPQYFARRFGLGLYLTIDNVNPITICYNGVQDPGETDIDCGGICEEPCGTYPIYIPSCVDMYQNGNETGVDCGGDCPPCGQNQQNGIPEYFGQKPDNYSPYLLGKGSFEPPPNPWQYPEPLQQPYWSASHGYTHILNKQKYWNNSTSEFVLVMGGVFWENDGFNFKSNKKYILDFYVQTGDTYYSNDIIWFALTNDLVNVNQVYPDPIIIPEPDEMEIIGYIPKNWYSCDYGVAKITIEFIPESDNFTQLWIYSGYLGDDGKSKSGVAYLTYFSLLETCLPELTYITSNIPDNSYGFNYIKAWDNALIESNRNISFKAGKYVLLLPNFETEINSVFSTGHACFYPYGGDDGLDDNMYNPKSVVLENGKTIDNYQSCNLSKKYLSDHIQIYPNPSLNGIFHIDINSDHQISNGMNVKVHNVYGDLIYNTDNFISGSILDLSMFSKGIYIIEISFDGYSFFSKNLIQ